MSGYDAPPTEGGPPGYNEHRPTLRDGTDGYAYVSFSALSKSYHAIEMVHVAAKKAANAHCPNPEQKFAYAQRHRDEVDWKTFFQTYSELCHEASCTAKIVADERADALGGYEAMHSSFVDWQQGRGSFFGIEGQYNREHGGFDEKGWQNHVTKVHEFASAATNWMSRAEDAKAIADLFS